MNPVRDPLVVYVVWRCVGELTLHPVAALVQSRLSGFSRPGESMEAARTNPPGIPVRFRAGTDEALPPPIAPHQTERAVVVLLIDDGMFQSRGRWGAWVGETIRTLGIRGSAEDPHTIVPVSDTAHGEKLCAPLRELSVIVAPLVPGDGILQLIAIRCLQAFPEAGQSTHGIELLPQVSVFLSHTKRGRGLGARRDAGTGGQPIAMALRDHLLKRTQARVFFDRNDIAPGQDVRRAIEAGIRGATMVVVLTDDLAESEWCLVEIQLARKHARPMLVIDALRYDLVRPPVLLGRAPHIRYGGRASLDAIVSAVALETLRERHFRSLVATLDQPAASPVLSPDDYDIARNGNIVYPDPPLPLIEAERLQGNGARLRTVLEALASRHFPAAERVVAPGSHPLRGLTFGLSISTADGVMRGQEAIGVTAGGLGQRHFDDLFCEVARLLVLLGGRIALGTDLRDGGFTTQLLDVLDRYAGAAARQDHVICYLPPLETGVRSAATLKLQRARADVVEVGWPGGGRPGTRADALTAMRRALNAGCQARLAFGGKLFDYEGEHPGALEELDLALSGNGPVYLLGGLGGVARAVYDVITGRPVPVLLTQAGQAAARPRAAVPIGYYEALNHRLHAIGPDGLAARNGLDPAENERLSESQSAIEIVDLVATGLARLQQQQRLPTPT